MKKEFQIISELIDSNKRVLDVPDFLNTIKNYLNTTYIKLNEKRI